MNNKVEIPCQIVTSEFLGYQQGLTGELPRKDLAHLGAYKKGYISALKHLSQQESQEIENTHRQLLKKNKAAEKDIIQKLDRLIQEQGLDDSRNSQLELLGFQDGVINKRAQEQFWSNYAYKKGVRPVSALHKLLILVKRVIGSPK